METYKTINGLTVRIERDTVPQNPREWDNAGNMVCWHRRYDLGDKHDFADTESFNKFWAENGEGGTKIPLYLYDHGGITIRTWPFSCPWDSGQVGWIYITAEQIREQWKVKRITKRIRERVRAVLEDEVIAYDSYLIGEVYGFVIERELPPCGECKRETARERVDSCWGFYSEDEALRVAKEHLTKEERDNLEEAD